MHKVLLALTLVLPTNYASHASHANYANFFGRKLPQVKITANNRASHVSEDHRRELLSDLETIISSTNDDDYFSATLQFTEEEQNEGEPGSIDLNLDETLDDHQYDVRCVVVEECAYCSDYKNDASPICQNTGRREKIECTFSSTGEHVAVSYATHRSPLIRGSSSILTNSNYSVSQFFHCSSNICLGTYFLMCLFSFFMAKRKKRKRNARNTAAVEGRRRMKNFL